MIYKIVWLLRAIIYKLIFGSFGNFCYFGTPKYIYGFKKIFIGKRVRIFPGARLEVHGQGLLMISDNCSIGNDLHLACAGKLEIGSGVLISSNVLITDIDHEYYDITKPVLEQPIKITRTRIGESCFLGSGAKILAGSIIGKHSIIGANAVVKGEFPDYCVIAGSPAKIVKIYNVEKNGWVNFKS